MTRIVVNAVPDANINDLDNTGNSKLHKAVGYLSLSNPIDEKSPGIIECIKRGANVNVHQRGNNITPLDNLFTACISGGLPYFTPDSKKIPQVMRVLLENGAKVKPQLLKDLICCLANGGYMAGSDIKINLDAKRALWRCVALCLHYGAKLDFNQYKETGVVYYPGALAMNLHDVQAIANLYVVDSFNKAVAKGVVEADKVSDISEIGAETRMEKAAILIHHAYAQFKARKAAKAAVDDAEDYEVVGRPSSSLENKM